MREPWRYATGESGSRRSHRDSAAGSVTQIPSTRLQQADTNTTVIKLAGKSNPSRPGPHDTKVSEDLLIVCDCSTNDQIITDF